MTTLRIDVPPPGAGDHLPVSPSLDVVRSHVGTYRQVPVSHTYLDDCETPVSAMLKLRDGGPCFLLESAEQGQRLGRYSMIGIDPQAVITARDGVVTLRRADGTEERLDSADPFGVIQSLVDDAAMAPPAEPLAFWGGAVGYFGYDMVRTVEHLPDVPHDDLGIPDMVMMLTGPVVLFDHLRRSTTIIVPCEVGDDDPGPAYQAAIDAIRAIKAPFRTRRPTGRPRSARSRATSDTTGSVPPWRPCVSTCTPATPSRWCRRSGSRPPWGWSPSRCTAGFAPSTPRPTCSSSTAATCSWRAHHPRCW